MEDQLRKERIGLKIKEFLKQEGKKHQSEKQKIQEGRWNLKGNKVKKKYKKIQYLLDYTLYGKVL